jgi:CheY-like chemotaxis protein
MSLVCKTDGERVVHADDVGLRVAHGAISIAGEPRFEQAEQSEKVYRRESLPGTFSRNLTLQDGGSPMPTFGAPVPILIVDNDVSYASALELMLHAAGQHETRVAHSAAAALAVAAVFKPSVILLEVELPDVNGYELAQTLRERARTRKLRLIALTTSREHEDRELARVAGFERYLLKPVTALDLANLLNMPGRAAR